MLLQNVIMKGRDNPVEISFSFYEGDFKERGLNTFSEVKVTLGSNTYSTVDNPDQVYIVNNTDLVLNIGSDPNLTVGTYLPEIIGISNVYTNGYELTGKCKPILGYLEVKDC